ncbi:MULTISPECIES: ammonia-forming cytochrome c nitrite reductase subunit c552 [Anaerolinea]|uniref:nitrite reductase (cytochrome; ammonia-forming) n=1 Tax=Anaerolinea thermophila (strain DSM 14523 / JCM 11388 / NBRC 100420 / UNI-1) TaxID=926569 RepID=E8N1Y5_ANATU|nr:MULTISPECIES: ammonia-forming cytochrome c nitrite reductase subunit c552 [Anaerolinea]BAJ64932.1 cytochrome c-552 [Anaerolinea thermophila UNI-1]
MKKFTGTTLILTGIIVVLSALLIGVLIFLRNQPAPQRGVMPVVKIAAMEPDSSIWGQNFPNQYSTFMMTESNNTATTYGGSDPYEKLNKDPMLKTLFAGNPFSKGYGEDRGHANALTDVENTPRLSDKTPGTCYSCKSADNPKLWSEMGMAEYDKTPFKQLGEKINHPIGCANCHDAETMRLIVTNPALEEALKEQGKDWRTFSRQEMRSLVCANCHVEYYFTKEGNYLTFPWEKGTNVEAMEAYYNEIGFFDWKHADSGANMIKMQHPDYEMYTANSTHYKAGVACADCHMPYMRDGAAKFSSHNVKSPLLDPARSCGTCHTDVNYVVERVNIIQKNVYDTMQNTEKALVSAINAIKTASENPNADQSKLEEARKLHRAAQLRWDYVAAENSMGFHNPTEALRILAAATDLARQAELTALQAVQVASK